MPDKKTLTERQQLLLDLILSHPDGDIRSCMNEAGYSPNTKIRQAIEPIKDQLIDAASLKLATSAPKAVTKLIGVLDNPEALGNKNLIAAAERILDRSGLVKTERLQVEAETPGVFIVPPKDE